MDNMKSLRKSLDILGLFLNSKEELSLTEISQLSGIHESTSCRMASVLVKYGYLKQPEKRGKYSLGPIYLQFSGVIKSRFKSRDVAMPYLIELSNIVHEAVIIAAWNKRDAILTFNEVAHSETSDNSPLKIIPKEGATMPLHCTSVGKIILASASEEELQKYFNSQAVVSYTLNTINDFNSMWNHLIIVKRDEVAFDDEEYHLGVRGVGAGLKNKVGIVIGGIGVIAPSIRLSRTKMQEIAPIVKEYAAKISKDLELNDFTSLIY